MYLDSRRSFIAMHSNQPKKANRENIKCIFPVECRSNLECPAVSKRQFFKRLLRYLFTLCIIEVVLCGLYVIMICSSS